MAIAVANGAQEAWEEADFGIVVVCVLGRYCYTKRGQALPRDHLPARVTPVADRWPERQPRRRWVPIHQAADCTSQPSPPTRALGGLVTATRAA